MEEEHENGKSSPFKKRSAVHCPSSPKKRLKLDIPSAIESSSPIKSLSAVAKTPPVVMPTNGTTSHKIKHDKITSFHRNKQFIYGNYNRYYGYRYTEKDTDDIRVKAFEGYRELFDGNDILDVGCNDGSVTIAVARKFPIKSITGIDIDRNLIDAAEKRQIRDFTINNNNDKIETKANPDIFGNLKFKHCNYVLNSDDLLEFEEVKYDTILCLSVTKWMHLNFGDNGLKRAFKRMYKQLKENGVLILEAQNWKSYKRRKSLTPGINAHFKDIQLKPDQFHDYLLSEEIGFDSSFVINLPQEHSINGFKRPLIAYRKQKVDSNR